MDTRTDSFYCDITEKAARQLHRDVDVFKPGSHKLHNAAEYFVAIYYISRFHRVWSEDHLARLRPLVLPLADYIPRGIIRNEIYGRVIDPPRIVLLQEGMSTLRLLSEDFPEIAEVLLYSKEMQYYERMIDLWRPHPPYHNYGDLWYARQKQKRYHSNHPWWSLCQQVTSLDGLPVEVAKMEFDAALMEGTGPKYEDPHWPGGRCLTIEESPVGRAE